MADHQKLLVKTWVKVVLSHSGCAPEPNGHGDNLGHIGTCNPGTAKPGVTPAVPKGKVLGGLLAPCCHRDGVARDPVVLCAPAHPAGQGETRNGLSLLHWRHPKRRTKRSLTPSQGRSAGPGGFGCAEMGSAPPLPPSLPPPPPAPLDNGSRDPQVSPCPSLTGLASSETPFEEHLEEQFSFT